MASTPNVTMKSQTISKVKLPNIPQAKAEDDSLLQLIWTIVRYWQPVQGIQKVKSAKGAAGIYGQSVGAFASNLEINLKQLQLELQSKQYRAQPVKRVETPKDNGGVRMLGIRSRSNSGINAIEHSPTYLRY
ncbi:hypothetical protein [Colwellia sp. UCD-KL20]|uniref:hypothetical protein n=1 Tax=Colwellia sp. UCD-KL20 TaxID=1917165 RepID=UPI0025705FC2|nr:hypothetical protein [Colwellia sp. UCD-KL20]